MLPPILRLRTTLPAALIAAVVFCGAAPVRADEAALLSVTGRGEASATPDLAIFTTGVVSGAKTADEALAANSKQVESLIASIKEAGIADADVQTANFSVFPQYSNPASGSREAAKVTGYEVRNSVTVTVRDLARLPELLDKSVQAGANQTSGLRFTLADPSGLESKARLAALADAQAQAAEIAKAAGVRLLRLRRIGADDMGGIALPAPMMLKAEARSVPVEAGETTARGQITLVYEIEPL